MNTVMLLPSPLGMGFIHPSIHLLFNKDLLCT